MKKVILSFFFTIIILGIQFPLFAQPIVDFTLPDSSCVGAQINITNLTTGGSTYYWNFCSGNANNDPTGINLGNPGNLLNVPGYMTLVQDGNDCYSFITNQFVSGIVRYYHGTTFGHDPISWTALGTFGLLSDSVEGIQIKKDNGTWYGFVCNDNRLVRLNFGASLANTPTAVSFGPYSGLTMLSGFVLLKEGTTWVGFANCSYGDKFVRFNFGNSLNNTPTITNFGDLGVMSIPGPLSFIQESSMWYAIQLNENNTLDRLTFGNSLLNVPTGENLGTPEGFNDAGGLSIIRDCNSTTGYFTNYITDGELGKLTFSDGITGTVIGQNLGNVGILNRPHSFSEIFRQNDTLFTYITNRGSFTLTRLTFPPCTNASVPSSVLFNPPPFSYDQPGTYNVRLLVNEGSPDQVSLCKTIVVGPVPMVNLGPDRSICTGQSTTLDAGSGLSSYLWSTGATTRTINVDSVGTYWVRVSNYNCTASDTINVSYLMTDCSDDLWFPTAFTPNGDGVNDFFRPKGLSITKFHMMIYSRWGQLLFETEDMNSGWDGTVSGTICPADTYTFIATYEGTDNPGKTKKQKGSFILLR
jgi:gliding motility-associated-like protein